MVHRQQDPVQTDLSRNSQSVTLAGTAISSCAGGCLQDVEAADLTLGKPCLVPLSAAATVGQALKALRHNKDVDVLSVWLDNEAGDALEQKCGRDRYRCAGVVGMTDIVTFLARDQNLADKETALATPLSALLPALSQAVEHVHPRTSLCQALDTMLDGVQHLVVPMSKPKRHRKPQKAALSGALPVGDYCWITQEDVMRHLLSSLGTFYPLPTMSLETLGLINSDVMMVDADSPAAWAVPFIERASREMTAVAVVSQASGEVWEADDDEQEEAADCEKPRLIGDISPQTLRGCNETAAGALAALSVREFLQFAHDGSDSFQRKITSSLRQKALCRATSDGLLSQKLDALGLGIRPLSRSSSGISTDSDDFDYTSGSGSDEDLHSSGGASSISPDDSVLKLVRRASLAPAIAVHARARTMITCRPESTLVAVMAQALANRVNHIWVTDSDGGLVGIVTYADMIDVLLSQLHSMDG